MAFAKENPVVVTGSAAQAGQVSAVSDRTESQQGEFEGPVLIEGTRGTGKRALARAIHASSSRRRKMFRVFNCRSCSPLEMRRLFLGESHGDRRAGGRYIRFLGLFEEVAEGTLYLEEVEHLPRDMQRILGEVIRDQAFRPIGSETDLPFRGRVILSTCADARAADVLSTELVELSEGTFQTGGPRV